LPAKQPFIRLQYTVSLVYRISKPQCTTIHAKTAYTGQVTGHHKTHGEYALFNVLDISIIDLVLLKL